jgi:hypothetical protein
MGSDCSRETAGEEPQSLPPGESAGCLAELPSIVLLLSPARSWPGSGFPVPELTCLEVTLSGIRNPPPQPAGTSAQTPSKSQQPIGFSGQNVMGALQVRSPFNYPGSSSFYKCAAQVCAQHPQFPVLCLLPPLDLLSVPPPCCCLFATLPCLASKFKTRNLHSDW